MGDEDESEQNEGETYWVRTRSELTGVVSERVLTDIDTPYLVDSNQLGVEVVEMEATLKEISSHWGQTPIYPAGTLRVF